MSCIYIRIYYVYVWYMYGISIGIHMYGISKDIPYIYHTYTIHMKDNTICMVYTIHIPCIYQKSGFQMKVWNFPGILPVIYIETYTWNIPEIFQNDSER